MDTQRIYRIPITKTRSALSKSYFVTIFVQKYVPKYSTSIISHPGLHPGLQIYNPFGVWYCLNFLISIL